LPSKKAAGIMSNLGPTFYALDHGVIGISDDREPAVRVGGFFLIF